MTATTASGGFPGGDPGPSGMLAARIGPWLAWVLPFAAAAALIGWETDWGRRIAEQPLPEAKPEPTPVQVALLPEYRLEGGADARRETVERTLFNPTRRPAPPAAQAAAAPKMQRGQFVLTGTAVAGPTTIAFLREVNGGKSRSARPGDVLNGMKVAEVRPDRVKLTLGDETEDLVLRVAAGPRTTTQPTPAPAGQPGQPAQPMPPQPAAAGTGAVPQPTEAPTLLERRRAARAAAGATGEAPNTLPAPGTAPAVQPAPAPAPAAAPAAPGQSPAQPTDPKWNDVFNRMMQRGR